MRVFIIGFIIALAFSLPYIAQLREWDPPSGMGLLLIPCTGLNYIITMFHELGHFFAAWFFGSMAAPAFDFVNGGGVTPTSERSMIVLGFVYFIFAYALWLQWKGGEMRRFAVIAGVLVLHIIASLTVWHDVIFFYMGHGFEMMVAGFCIFRATLDWPDDARGRAEKYLNMVFGIYTLMHNLIMNVGLMTSAAMRNRYANAKGGHMVMDFDRIAEELVTKVQYVAGFSTIFLFLCTGLIAWLVIARPWQHD